MHRSPLALALALALTSVPSADQLVTVDNRVIDVKKAREEGDQYRLTFEHGEILCPKSMVKAVEIEGDMSDYVPQDDRERDLLEKGYVRYRGKWMSKPAYMAELGKKAEASRERAAELAAHAEFESGYEKETKHFKFRSNTSPEILDHYADLLEAYYKLMDKRIGIKPSPNLRKVKMNVRIYKSHDDFSAHNEEMGRSTLGYFWSVDHSLNFFHDYPDPDSSNWVALHECTHLLTYLVDPGYLSQIWLNEAVADFYGSSTIERDKRGKFQITPGRLQTDRVLTVQQAIADGEDIPLKELFLITRENFHGFQYAHAWSFVYFLHQDKKREKGFRKAFKEIYTTSIPKMDAERLDAGWADTQGQYFRWKPEQIRDHLMSRIGEKDVEALDEEWKAFVKAIPIDSADAKLKRGLRSARFPSDDSEQAMSDLNDAIEAGIEDARAWWGRAWLAFWTEFMSGWEKGEPDLREAIRRDPLNPEYRHDLAFFLTGFWNEEKGEFFRGTGGLEEAKVQYSLAAALDPDSDRYREALTEFEEWYEVAKGKADAGSGGE